MSAGMSGGFVRSNFLKLTSKFLNLSKSHMRNIYELIHLCISQFQALPPPLRATPGQIFKNSQVVPPPQANVSLKSRRKDFFTILKTSVINLHIEYPQIRRENINL